MGKRRLTRKQRAALVATAMTAAVATGAWFNEYRFHVAEVIDSDTYRGSVSLWPGMAINVDIRVDGIDTPEKFRPSKLCPEHERLLASLAGELVEERIADADYIIVSQPKPGKYAGRTVAKVWLIKGDSKKSMAEMLLESGLAVAYDGGTKTADWCAIQLPGDQ